MKVDSARDSGHILLSARNLVTEALKKGVRDALLRHRERGLPVVIDRDGSVVWVRVEDLLAADALEASGG
jgi:hypothetical protein